MQWSEANMPVLMEMEVSKVCVYQHPADTLTGIHKEDSCVHALLWPCLFEAAWDLFLSMQLCINAVLCKLVGLSLHRTLAHLHQYEWDSFASAINYHVLHFSDLSFFLFWKPHTLCCIYNNPTSPLGREYYYCLQMSNWGTKRLSVRPMVTEKVQGRCIHLV